MTAEWATVEWSMVEHLPTRKLLVWFDGRNGAEIARLVGDDDKCQWDGYELLVKNSQGEFRAHPGNPVLYELDGTDIYTPPAHVVHTQYKVVDP